MDSVSVKFIVDTGCPVTIINEHTFKHIGASFVNRPIEHTVNTANGTQAKVLGYARVQLQIKNYSVSTIVGVVNRKIKDCLLGMDLLESCSLTSNVIAQLHHLIESKTSPTRPKQVKRLNKLILSFDKNINDMSTEWKQVSESPVGEFFENIEMVQQQMTFQTHTTNQDKATQTDKDTKQFFSKTTNRYNDGTRSM
jgi:hypothetical protein